MRIAVVAPVWFPVPPTGYGGIELVVSLLADGLVDAGHDVTLFASGGSRTKAAARLADAPSRPTRSELGNPWYDGFHALSSYLQVDGFDIVHDHAGIVGPICGAMLQGKPPVVHTLHGPWTDQNRLALRARSRSTCTSSRSATRNAPPTSTSRTPAPCTTASTSSAYTYRADKERRRSSTSGAPTPTRDRRRRSRSPGAPACRCSMILKRGEPPEREYFEHEIEPLLASDVELYENVTHDEKVELLGRACAMVFPIRWPEPFGLVMIEAMACGTPVVTTNWGAAPELVDDGVTGFRRDGDDDLVEMIGRGRELLDPPRAGPGSRTASRARRWSGATRPSSSRSIPALTPEISGRSDFHYGRSVITMAAVAEPPCRPAARRPPGARDRRPPRLRRGPRDPARRHAWPVEPGALHALMGPNGSGKSTLANTLLGNPAYVVTAGRILLAGDDITDAARSRSGPRSASSSASSTPRRSPASRCSTSCARRSRTRKGIDDYSVLEVRMQLIAWTKRLGMDTRFQERYLNEGFSGGEKKRNEVLQMAMLEPDDGGARRDRLRSRHRRAAPGRGRHRGGPQGPHRARHPADHALPAHPRPPRPRRRARARSTAGSSRPATPRSRRDGRGRAASTRSAPRRRRRRHERARRRRDPARLPAPRARGQRQARHVPRLRVVGAEAARRARRDGRLLPPLLRQHPPRRLHDRRGGDRRLRARPPQGRRASSTRRPRRRSCSPATRPSRSTSSPTRGPAPTCAPATRSCSRTWSTTPTSCRGTCSPPSAASSCAGSR